MTRERMDTHAARRRRTPWVDMVPVAGAALVLVLAPLVALSEPPPEHHGGHAAAATDKRAPLPLLPMMAEHQKQNMRDHLAAIQEIVAALAKDDYDAVATATRRIGYSESMGQMCEHMGAGAPAFTPMALNFHRTADTIADAARAHDRPATLAAVARTLETCVGCHAAFRQEIVDDATWSRLTSSQK